MSDLIYFSNALSKLVTGSKSFFDFDLLLTTKPNFGAKSTKLENYRSNGKNLTQVPKPKELELKWLIDAYRNFPKYNTFFLNGFDRIAGNSILKEQIISGISEKEIRQSWRPKLKKFKKIREKYLIYN